MTRKSQHPTATPPRPYKVLWFGDLVQPSGFGRIGNEVTRRLKARGYDVLGAGMLYSGWPHDLPFHVFPLTPAEMWNTVVSIWAQWQPDIIVSCQDFPYHQTLFHACRIDFSRTKWVWITPIDGTPIHPEWLKLADLSDGQMVISRFGVEALRQAGKRVALCHPGVDTTEFYPAEADEKQALRAKTKAEKASAPLLAPGDYVTGVMCMNQGRKAIAPMIEAWAEFARDKPEARLYLDMDKSSPAGWDIPNLLAQMGWTDDEKKRVIYREDLMKADGPTFAPLRNRYALLDAHMVISHREGFGLPLLESMACRLPTLALDWCSGTEIVGEGRGVLVRRLPYMEHGTWGGARDAFPDLAHLVTSLNYLYGAPEAAAAIARAGYEWAVKQTWDVAADQVETVIQAALARDRKERPSHEPSPLPQAKLGAGPAPGLSDTRGPAASPDPIGGHPGLQPAGGGDPLPALGGPDRGSAGSAGAAADPGSG
jgi:glycosyltransferase involved in cell wall biosynthesis